jgi:hypothetical protein
MTVASTWWRRARSVAFNAPCAVKLSRIGTPLGFLDFGSLPVQLGKPNNLPHALGTLTNSLNRLSISRTARPFLSLRRPPVRVGFARCHVPVDRRQRIGEARHARHWAESPLHDRDGMIRFQHRRKISSILIRNTVVPIAIRTTLGSCLGD